jgi:hypothetical protein
VNSNSNPDEVTARIEAALAAWESGPDAATWTAAHADADPQTAPPSTDELMRDLFGEPIHVYTRARALADGALVEADPQMCREAGLRWPVALTAAAWADCVAWTDADTRRTGVPQDQTGRLWDVLNMARFAFRRASGNSDRAVVELYRVPTQGRRSPQRVRLIAQCGPGDQAEPVITIMQPHED